jgi:hypothetical protein
LGERAWLGDKAAPVDNEGITREQVYQMYQDDLESAYKSGNQRETEMAYLLPQQGKHTGFGSRGPLETRKAGSRCTVRGQHGTMQYIDGALQCVPNGGFLSANSGSRDAATVQRDHRANMARLYQRLDDELQNEWKGQK